MTRKVWTCSMSAGGCLILALVWGILASPGSALADHKPGHNPGGGGGGGGSGGDIPVCVTFDDAVGDLVTSDGGGIYCDGVDGITAILTSRSGKLKLGTSESPRNVILNFPECDRLIGGGCSTDAALATMTDVLTGDKLDLRAMGEGETRFADVQIAFPSDVSRATRVNLIVFGGSNLGPNACGTPLPVYRVDAATWTIEATEADVGCLYEVVTRNGGREMTDTFPLPFKITIVAQP